jgi:hypothetical protein
LSEIAQTVVLQVVAEWERKHTVSRNQKEKGEKLLKLESMLIMPSATSWRRSYIHVRCLGVSKFV